MFHQYCSEPESTEDTVMEFQQKHHNVLTYVDSDYDYIDNSDFDDVEGSDFDDGEVDSDVDDGEIDSDIDDGDDMDEMMFEYDEREFNDPYTNEYDTFDEI
jgi:hypothetical protein